MTDDSETITIRGKTAFVTGAGQGIGRAIALALAKRGLAVAINTRHQESAQAVAKEIMQTGARAVACPADVSDRVAVRAAIAKAVGELGPIEILVNNAAAPAELRLLHEASDEDIDAELVTLLGTIYCTHAVCPSMIERRTGRIINISSVAGKHAMPKRAVYSAANAGIDKFTITMAKELGQYDITVNAVSPGAVESPRFKARSQDVRDEMARTIGLPRFGEPEDIAQAVVFLASDQADYISGTVLDVDGSFSGYLPPEAL